MARNRGILAGPGNRAIGVAIGVVLAACTRQVPPVAAPEAVAPRVEAPGDLAAGEGAVLVDVVDGPTDVMHFVSTEVVVRTNNGVPVVGTGTRTERLCTSPCWVVGPVGRFDLAFPIQGTDRVDVAAVDIRPEPTAYRRALARTQRPEGAGLVLGVVSTFFGGASGICGTVFLPVGLADDSDGFVIAGGITLGVGAVLTALGAWAIAANPFLEQPGSGVQIDLEAPRPAQDGAGAPAEPETPAEPGTAAPAAPADPAAPGP